MADATTRGCYDSIAGGPFAGTHRDTMQPSLRFTAVIELRGINPYVAVSARRAARLRKQWRRPMPVLVRIDGKPAGKPWRINMMPAGDGGFYLYLHKTVREASHTRVGDQVTVELAFDNAYRYGPLHAMPRWFSAALGSEPAAKANWARLPPSRRKEVLRYFAGLKSDAARQRNLLRAMSVLAGAPGRFMARSWSGGR